MNDNYENSNGVIDSAKEVAKAKAKKAMTTKLIAIFGPTIAFFLFIIIPILFVTAIVVALSSDGNISFGSNISYVNYSNNTKYWWPIGSSEAGLSNGVYMASGEPSLGYNRISSRFSKSRTINGVTRPHYGIDIGSGGEINVHNVIAIKDGIIYRVFTGCDDIGGYGNSCGGQLGNYVFIKHSDGSFSKYGHMAQGSITVIEGQAVRQGQVIGKVGNSGSSTGAHLHFQLEIGGLGQNYAVDPLLYLSASDYRPIVENVTSSFIEMLHSWEGTGPTNKDNYIVYDDGAGTLTVGCGVTLNSHADKFRKRGIDVSTLKVGSTVNKFVVDDIEQEIINGMRNNILNILNSNNITLESTQIDALLMRNYNVGNISGFVDNYNLYGNTFALYENYLSTPVKSKGKYMSGLVRRREAEWILFHDGIYLLNE